MSSTKESAVVLARTGLLWQDYQHTELIRTMRHVQQGILQRTLTQAQVEETMGFLQWYVRHHFGAEVVYMEQFDYPQREQHLAQHQALVDRLEYFRKVVDDGFGNPDLHACAELCVELNRWYLDHIAGPDQDLARFLLQQGVT